MKRIIYISLITLLFASCKEKYHVSGRVYNPITNEGLSGVRVTFKKFGDIGVGTPSGYEEVASTFTDANGNYDLKSKKQTSWVQIETDLYQLGSLQNGTYIANVTVNKKENMIVDWHAVPYGNFGLTINNINCQGPNDTIIINQQNQVNSMLDFDWILTGCSGYTTSIDKIPMGTVNIDWTVIRSGITTTFSDVIFVGEGQTVVYNLDY